MGVSLSYNRNAEVNKWLIFISLVSLAVGKVRIFFSFGYKSTIECVATPGFTGILMAYVRVRGRMLVLDVLNLISGI